MAKDAGLITIGSGAKIEIDDIDVGYLDGDVSFKRSAEIKVFTAGVPAKTVKRVPITDGFTAEFKLAQFTNKNIAIAALNLPYTEIAGGSVTVTNMPYTFTATPGRVLQELSLDGPGGTYDITAVKLTEGGSDLTNTSNANYFVDETYGRIARNPNGTIPSLGTVYVTYTFNRRAKSRIALGKTIAIATRKFFFQHLTPELREINVGIWKMQAASDFELLFSKENWNSIPIVGEAQDDAENHPNEPYGYIDEVEPIAA